MTDGNNSLIGEDPFLWLEEVEGDDALAWVHDQNKRSIDELQGDGRYQKLFDQASQILNSSERIPNVSLRGGYAYNFWQDQANPRGLWRRMEQARYLAGDRQWDILLNVDDLAEREGKNWVFKATDSLGGNLSKYIVTLSDGGSDAAERREFDIDQGKFVATGFALPESKSAVAWMDEDTLLVGLDEGGESVTTSGYPRVIKEWCRGEPTNQAQLVFEGESEDVGVWPFSFNVNGLKKVGFVRAISFFESETYLNNGQGDYKKLPIPLKSTVIGIVSGKIIISLQEKWEAHGQVFEVDALIALEEDFSAASLIFQPNDRQALESIGISDQLIYAVVLDNISGTILKFMWGDKGWRTDEIVLPTAGVASIGSVDESNGDALLLFETPTSPQVQYFVSTTDSEPVAVQAMPAFYNSSDVITKQYSVQSKDGTEIFYYVTAQRNTLARGPSPTIQYGYGGFQVSILPNYSGTTGKLWLENGGVYVTAHIRGGGEFGPKWHQAALKENRQKAFDDFFAVSEDLIAREITTPSQLGILGGSNGGLLMGVALTQRSELYAAIAIGVPLLDMMRFHHLLAGASWIGEYGNPEIPAEREYIAQYSPYQNISAQTSYPRPYFFTSTKDDRVHPGHARKMAAHMAQLGHDFLYFENTEGGHAASANQDQLAKRLALQYVYFLKQLSDQN